LDCIKSGPDGYCTYEKDNVCDPDCLAGEPDCPVPGEFTPPIEEYEFAPSVTEAIEAPAVTPERGIILWVGAGLLIVLILFLIFLLIRRKKHKPYAEKKFEQYQQK